MPLITCQVLLRGYSEDTKRSNDRPTERAGGGFLSADNCKGIEMITYNDAEIRGHNMFYREAGDNSASTIVLLHGFPASSHMYRNLIPQLADTFHVIAPDYIGFGCSDAPNVEDRIISPKTQRLVMRAIIRSESVSRPTADRPDLVVDLILAAARATLNRSDSTCV
jgi:hypothetical protein